MISSAISGRCKRQGTDAVAQPKREEIRYDAVAIDFMDDESSRFYDLWLDFAIEHALKDGRDKVEKQDAEAALRLAVNKLLEGKAD